MQNVKLYVRSSLAFPENRIMAIEQGVLVPLATAARSTDLETQRGVPRVSVAWP